MPTVPWFTNVLKRFIILQEIFNRTHWTDPEKTWASNSSSNLWRGPLVRSHSIFDGYFQIHVKSQTGLHDRIHSCKLSPGKSTILNGIYQDVDEDSHGRFVSFKESNGGLLPSWWFQPLRKRLVKMGTFPGRVGMKIYKNWNHHQLRYHYSMFFTHRCVKT